MTRFGVIDTKSLFMFILLFKGEMLEHTPQSWLFIRGGSKGHLIPPPPLLLLELLDLYNFKYLLSISP